MGMKRILVIAVVGLLVAGAVAAQTNERALIAKERAAIDSIAASGTTIGTWLDSLAYLANSPTPVTVSEHNIFTGLNLMSGAAGSATNLNMVGGGLAYRTFPVAGGVDVHGAKAMYLVLDWTKFSKGYFTIQHLFSPSSTDTLFNYWDGNSWSVADTIVVNDSTGVGALTGMATTAGSLVFRVPDLPGEGYYFCKIKAHDKVHVNWVLGLNATLVVVQ